MPLSPKQMEVLEQVEALLGEHVDSFVVIYDVADVDGTTQHLTGSFSQGGPVAVLGLIETKKAKTLADFLKPDPPKESA